jgi:hypothetical protein
VHCGPTLSTTPAKSQPMMYGVGNCMATMPARMYVSIGFTDTAPTLTRTSPAFGSGVGKSPY